MNIELIYDKDCPNVMDARAALLRAFPRSGHPPRWTEWERSAPEAPAYARAYGSPTILIDGKDVAGAQPHNGDSCRVYTDGKGELRGTPSFDLIVARLNGSTGASALLAALPTGGALILPIGACPACWPAYAGFLGAFGLGFLLSERYLLPVAGVLLAITLAMLAHRAPLRRGYRPFFLGLTGAATALTAKFLMPSEPVLLAGLGLIFAAAVWNAWPRRQAASCPDCPISNPEPQKEHSQ